MNVVRVAPEGITEHEPSEIAGLLDAGGFLWIDAPHHADIDPSIVVDVLGVLKEDLDAAGERSLLPRVQVRDGYASLIVQALDPDGRLFQMDELISEKFLLTIHGPRPGTYEADIAVDMAAQIRRDLQQGALVVENTSDLGAALVGKIADALEANLSRAANSAGMLDRQMREKKTDDPEKFLEAAFSVRHDLVTIGNRLTQSREACGLLANSSVQQCRQPFEELRGRFAQLRTVLDGETEFLRGMLDYYESLTNTKMNIAMERLAVIAAVALPITAIGGILGMNTIVSSETHVIYTILLLAFMGALAFVMLVWAKRRGWW